MKKKNKGRFFIYILLILILLTKGDIAIGTNNKIINGIMLYLLVFALTCNKSNTVYLLLRLDNPAIPLYAFLSTGRKTAYTLYTQSFALCFGVNKPLPLEIETHFLHMSELPCMASPLAYT